MSSFFNDIGQIIALVYTAAVLFHILRKGYIKDTMREYARNKIS